MDLSGVRLSGIGVVRFSLFFVSRMKPLNYGLAYASYGVLQVCIIGSHYLSGFLLS